MFRNTQRIAVGLALAGALVWGVALAASNRATDVPPEAQMPIWMATQLREIFPH